MKQKFSHFDEKGKSRMVDVGKKKVTRRMARARGFVKMKTDTLNKIQTLELPKGNPLEIARIAGILAAKQTPNLIPMCHPIIIDFIDVEINQEKDGIEIISEVRCTGTTGVEMEALTAVSTAALTIYDMCKSIDKSMVIKEIKLLEKHGGKSGSYLAAQE